MAEQDTGAVFVGGRHREMCAKPRREQTNTSPLQRPVWKPPRGGRAGCGSARRRGEPAACCEHLPNVGLCRRISRETLLFGRRAARSHSEPRGWQSEVPSSSAVQSTYPRWAAAAVEAESPALLPGGVRREGALLFSPRFERSPEASGGQSLVACVPITPSRLHPQSSLACYTRRSTQQMQQLSGIL